VKAVLFLPVALAACRGVSLSTDFEGASAGRIEKVGETEFVCHLPGQADHDGRNRQVTWYAFRIEGARGREVTVHLADLRGEYDYKPAAIAINGEAPPLQSADGRSWRHLDSLAFDQDKEVATLRVTPEGDSLLVAHLELYTPARLDRFLAEIGGHPDLKDEVIGKSVEGRDLHLLTITHPGSGEKKTVWLMCRQHAWESGTSFVGEGAIRFLLSPEGARLRDRIVFKIFPMMDPDGCARGGVRFNRNGYDLNRNWDTVDPANPETSRLMPEIAAAKRAFAAGPRGDLFLTLHNQERGEWLSGSETHAEVAERLFARLVGRTSFSPRGPRPEPPRGRSAPGRVTVYEYIDSMLGWPGFLLEQGIAPSPKLGRLPTSQDRSEFGAQLVNTMAEVILGR
jgi:hypothetical protein